MLTGIRELELRDIIWLTGCAQLSGVAAAKKTAQPTKEESDSDSDKEMGASKDKGRGMIKNQQQQ